MRTSVLDRMNLSYLPGIYQHLPSIDISSLQAALSASADIDEVMKSAANFGEIMAASIEGVASLTRHITADLAAMNVAASSIESFGSFATLISLFEFDVDAVEAFKAAGWPVAPSMPLDLRKRIVSMHKQDKTRYVSNVVMGYYRKNSHENLRSAVDSWEKNPLFTTRMHIIRDALDAHCNGKFTLSIPATVPQIEGVLNDYVRVNNLPARLGKITEVYEAVIGDPNDYPLSSWVIVSTLLHQLQTNTYTYTDFKSELAKSIQGRNTTRHTVLHGIVTNYNRPIHSLKAFLLLDALSALQ